jgi:hypothetical protein
MEHNMEKSLNMKPIMCIFEELSGLRINFQKSEVSCFGKAEDALEDYRNYFGCEVASFPVRYLGIPIHFRKLIMVNGSSWKTSSRGNLQVGSVNYSRMGIAWFLLIRS